MTTEPLPPPSVYWEGSVAFWRGMLALHPDEELSRRHLVFSLEKLRLAQAKEKALETLKQEE